MRKISGISIRGKAQRGRREETDGDGDARRLN